LKGEKSKRKVFPILWGGDKVLKKPAVEKLESFFGGSTLEKKPEKETEGGRLLLKAQESVIGIEGLETLSFRGGTTFRRETALGFFREIESKKKKEGFNNVPLLENKSSKGWRGQNRKKQSKSPFEKRVWRQSRWEKRKNGNPPRQTHL